MQRFNMWCQGTHGHGMSATSDGAYVRYADAQAELDQWRGLVEELTHYIDGWRVDNDNGRRMNLVKKARARLAGRDGG
jgi:hypothetical protein